MKKINKQSISNIAWSLFFVLILAGLLVVSFNFNGVICLVKLVEEKDYYMNFLWPRMYGYINAFMGLTIFISGYFYAECMMDVEMKLDKKEELLIKNVAMITLSIAGIIYILVGIFLLKSFNPLMIILGIVIIFAVISVTENVKEYRGLLNNDVDYDKMWSVVNVRINMILFVMVGCAALCFATLNKSVSEARIQYENVNNERINYCFGHIQGVENNRATVKVEFVNMYGPSGRDYDIEQLEQEYTNYKTGNGSWSNLWLFCQDSIDAQLESQVMAQDFSTYPYLEEYHSDLANYYVEKDSRDNEKYYETVRDRLNDMKYFCACVEDELNLKGLTLRELNDSWDNGVYDIGYDDRFTFMNCQSATPEQVIEACKSFAQKKEPVDGSQPQPVEAESIDLSIDVGIGDRIEDVSIVETNGYNIADVKWVDMGVPGQEKNASMDNKERIIDGNEYEIHVYVDVPLTYDISEDIVPAIEGIEPNELAIDWEYDRSFNQLKIDISFAANVYNQLNYRAMEMRLDYFIPDEQVKDCSMYPQGYCGEVQEIKWQIFDVSTGTVEEYSGETFSVDNTCYIANIKLVPYEDVSLDELEYIYFQETVKDRMVYNGVRIYEYDESRVREPGVGVYPSAYFKKSSEDGQEYIWISLPYYQVHTTGVDGDVVNVFGDNNYVYAMKDGNVKFRDKPKLDYEISRYEVTGIDGNNVFVPQGRLNDADIPMPAEPIVITGYFESKY